MKYTEWEKTLPQAKELYKVLFGTPSNSKEYIDSFNKIALINKFYNDEIFLLLSSN